MLLTREQLQERLFALHRASLELVKDVSLDHLLNQIATLACEQAEARYAALGVLDDDGKLDKFVSVGLTKEQIEQIPAPTCWAGFARRFNEYGWSYPRTGHRRTILVQLVSRPIIRI